MRVVQRSLHGSSAAFGAIAQRDVSAEARGNRLTPYLPAVARASPHLCAASREPSVVMLLVDMPGFRNVYDKTDIFLQPPTAPFLHLQAALPSVSGGLFLRTLRLRGARRQVSRLMHAFLWDASMSTRR